MNAADFYQLLYQTPFASTNARQRAWPFRMSRVNPEAICIGGDAGANTSPTQEPPMQATFYCHWCQSYKPVSTGYKRMGPRRRKCQKCLGNTTPPVAQPAAAPGKRSNP